VFECGGDNSSCADCAGTPNGDAEEDCAGVCGGSASNCPDWEDNPGGYSLVSAMVAGVVFYDEMPLAGEGDQLAALDKDGNVRGVGVQDIAPFGPLVGQLYYEMTIRSNDVGDVITFQYYDASADMVYDISETYEFNPGDQLGHLVTGAYEMNIYSSVDLAISLIGGYNWISFNVDPEDYSVASILAPLGDDALFVQSQTSGTATNYGTYGWYGSLETLSTTDMYLLEVAAEGDLVVNTYLLYLKSPRIHTTHKYHNLLPYQMFDFEQIKHHHLKVLIY
jgi:hypothetical protein